jgi:hypothetical protein
MRKKTIVILFNHIVREYKALKRLKDKLEEVEDVEVYLYSEAFEIHKVMLLSKRKRIDMIIASICTETIYELLAPLIEENEGIRVVSLYAEQVFDDLSKDVCLPPVKYQNNMFHFVWNDLIKDILIAKGVSEDLIYINGNIRSDDILDSSRLKKKEELAKEFNLDMKKKWILFAEGRNAYKDYAQEDFREEAKRLSLDEELNVKAGMIKKESFWKTLDDISSLNETFFDKYELIFRPHPSSNEDFVLDSRAHKIFKYSIYDWLYNVELNVVWNSTSAFEAEAMGVPPLVCEVMPNIKEAIPYGIEQYIKISSLSEINDEIIERAIQKMSEKTYEYFMSKVDGKCTERTAKAIVDVLEKKPVNPIVIEKRIDKVLFIKYILYAAIVEFLAKTRLLDAIKKPTHAYSVKKDIPFYKDNLNV